MQVAIASEPGSPGQPNEDGVVVTANMAAIFGGMTVRTGTGCIHDVPWYVDNLAGELVKHKDLALAERLGRRHRRDS